MHAVRTRGESHARTSLERRSRPRKRAAAAATTGVDPEQLVAACFPITEHRGATVTRVIVASATRGLAIATLPFVGQA